MLSGVRAVIKDYLLNSSLHGLRFIANDKLHWTERVFWLICVLLSWFATILLILASINAFYFNAISFGMETTYKDWDTYFPAVAVCENSNDDKLYNISDTKWPGHDIEFEDVLRELAYYKGILFFTINCIKPDPDPLCPRDNLSYYANLIRSDCKDTIIDCTFNDKIFECCDVFKPIQTDMGTCYIANSQQVQYKDDDAFEMISNTTHGPGMLAFKVIVDKANVYIIDDEEVPSLTTRLANFFQVDKSERLKYRKSVSIKNMENDPMLREISPEYRNCRYPDENYLDVYPRYSRSACIVQCRKDWQKKWCNCSDHNMPNTSPKDQCNLTGLVCLNDYKSDLTVLKAPWAKKSGLVCDCPQSCTEDDLSFIRAEKLYSRSGHSEVEIAMENLPSERFKRNVVRGRLDLVVSTGGTTGLFIGASLLSFVELFYYLSIRLYGTYYMKKRLQQVDKDTEKTMPKNTSSLQIFDNNTSMAVINIRNSIPRKDLYSDLIDSEIMFRRSNSLN